MNDRKRQQYEAFQNYIRKVPKLKDTWTGWRLELLRQYQFDPNQKSKHD